MVYCGRERGCSRDRVACSAMGHLCGLYASLLPVTVTYIHSKRYQFQAVVLNLVIVVLNRITATYRLLPKCSTRFAYCFSVHCSNGIMVFYCHQWRSRIGVQSHDLFPRYPRLPSHLPCLLHWHVSSRPCVLQCAALPRPTLPTVPSTALPTAR